ncbi:MAG: amidase [Candidatus Eisenbacteria bacterium]|nr:amidase [Candidatus Eisenbacteria bacterium]
MIGEDVLYLPVSELSARIRTHQLSPVELTRAYLDRIRKLSPRLNAFETVAEDVALMQARNVESELNRGHWLGPLHGIPYGAKDLLATSGIRTTWGARPLKEQVFDHDATVVRKLRDAGAVLLGKCAMVELAGGLGYRFADASVSGPGRNPWNPSRWTGGSSSGSGAAVAAGLAGFALGTETWGSILCPAAFCGITGLRPTYGRVSRAGAMVCSWTFDKIGPLARSAADCRLVLQAIAGADPANPSAASEPVKHGTVKRDWSNMRAASAVSELRAMGLDLVEAKLPDFPASELAGLIISAEAISAFEKLFEDGRVLHLRDVYAAHQPEINAAVSGADLVKAWRMRAALQERMADFFGDWDVIVTPNFLSVASRIEDDLYQALPYSDPVGAIGNACGLPAIALPCGYGKEHMPASFQIVAAPWDEGLLLDLGEAFQRSTVFHLGRPPVE